MFTFSTDEMTTVKAALTDEPSAEMTGEHWAWSPAHRTQSYHISHQLVTSLVKLIFSEVHPVAFR